MKAFFSIITVLSLVLISCNSNNDKQQLAEAATVHNKALALATTLAEKIATLQYDSMQYVSPDSLLQWRSELDAWHESVVEVPGFEHEHHHDHNDNHDHHKHTTVQVTASEMMRIQQELLKRIEVLNQRVEIYYAKSSKEK